MVIVPLVLLIDGVNFAAREGSCSASLLVHRIGTIRLRCHVKGRRPRLCNTFGNPGLNGTREENASFLSMDSCYCSIIMSVNLKSVGLPGF